MVVFWLAVDMIHGKNIDTNLRIFKVVEKAKTVTLLDYAYKYMVQKLARFNNLYRCNNACLFQKEERDIPYHHQHDMF